MKKTIVLVTLLSVFLLGCGKQENKEEIMNGTYNCTKLEESGGENAQSTVYVEIVDDKISKVYSTLEFKTEEAFKNVCDGLEITNKYSENKVDYECNNNTIKFLDYFQTHENKNYSYKELILDLKSTGFGCTFNKNE